jgi:hypothetical protein
MFFLQTFFTQKHLSTMRLLGKYLNDDESGDIKLMAEVANIYTINIAGS